MKHPPAQYWMVHGVGQGATRFVHPTRESAETEARRLAEKHHGTPFVVLEGVAAITRTKTSIVTYRARKPPILSGFPKRLPASPINIPLLWKPTP